MDKYTRDYYSNVKPQWCSIGSKENYFRSQLEVRFAWFLEDLKIWGTIESWEYEPRVFYFDKIKTGVRGYRPDFYINRSDGESFWVECKGWMDPKSKTKLRRFLKYYPQERMILVRNKKDFSAVAMDDIEEAFLNTLNLHKLLV